MSDTCARWAGVIAKVNTWTADGRMLEHAGGTPATLPLPVRLPGVEHNVGTVDTLHFVGDDVHGSGWLDMSQFDADRRDWLRAGNTMPCGVDLAASGPEDRVELLPDGIVFPSGVWKVWALYLYPDGLAAWPGVGIRAICRLPG